MTSAPTSLLDDIRSHSFLGLAGDDPGPERSGRPARRSSQERSTLPSPSAEGQGMIGIAVGRVGPAVGREAGRAQGPRLLENRIHPPRSGGRTGSPATRSKQRVRSTPRSWRGWCRGTARAMPGRFRKRRIMRCRPSQPRRADRSRRSRRRGRRRPCCPCLRGRRLRSRTIRPPSGRPGCRRSRPGPSRDPTPGRTGR